MSLCKRINIFELNRKINERKNIEKISYEKVLDICHKKILKSSEELKFRTIIELPEHVFGFPLYDLNNCMSYIINSLKKDGFIIEYFFPKVLYISWDLDEIQNSKDNNVMKIKLNEQSKKKYLRSR